ncbi:MAG TPA: glycosyl hydrolase family 28-related protein [Candidatus Acidoferrum sp.]|nr:glycosyl hydrolase family 28-related protein [Candidatus Acidoferrum sp.]
MKTTGAVLGPKYAPFLVETESSHQRCVKLSGAGESLEFTAQSAANAIVVRYSLPDSERGGGLNSTLRLYQNGKLARELPVTSRYSWLYGQYPFSNNPAQGKPRNFYDEVRASGLVIARGDVLRLEKADSAAPYCIIDLVDLETAPPALSAPPGALSVTAFGAGGKGESDDTDALRRCLAEARSREKAVWVPPGTYRITGDINLSSGTTIQGAGMWHTSFVGDGSLYGQPDRRVRFRLKGEHIRLADFAIIGRLNYRNDNEPNDGVVGAQSANCTLSRLWVEHTKVGMWFYNCGKLLVEGCRFRNTLADGINLCVDTRETVVQNCTARGTGDDCFAIWPAPSDQGFRQQQPSPGLNVFRHCTGQLPFLANGGAIYGGASNCIEDCLFADISTGCGILLSTTFPTADDKLGIDNNFSGTTVIRNCDLVRCGGYDHGWAWRGAFQLCMDRRSISGVDIRNVTVTDSLSDGLTIVAPGCRKGLGILANARLQNVTISNCGLGAERHRGLWVREDAAGSLTLVNSTIADVVNSSTNFTILKP